MANCRMQASPEVTTPDELVRDIMQGTIWKKRSKETVKFHVIKPPSNGREPKLRKSNE
jgi:hypothetical protein